MKTINKTWNWQRFLNAIVKFKVGGEVHRKEKKWDNKDAWQRKTAVWQAFLFFGSNKELAVVYSMTYTLD